MWIYLGVDNKGIALVQWVSGTIVINLNEMDSSIFMFALWGSSCITVACVACDGDSFKGCL